MPRNLQRLALITLAASLMACVEDEGGAPKPDGTGDGLDGLSVAETTDAADTFEVSTVPTLPSLAQRGLQEARVIAHLHSAFSHDACDEEGLDEDGNANWSCVQRMKDALCREAIDVAFMTDHPSFLRDQPFEDLLYGDAAAGDVVHRDDADAPWGVTYACPEGQGGLDGQARLLVGFEGTHTMPLGIRRHFHDPSLYGVSFQDETPSEQLSDLTHAVREAGGRVAIAHSEEPDLSWEVIANHDVAAMEVYNFHANFNVLLNTGQLDKIFEMEPFVGTAGEPGDPDLAALIMLGSYPVPALEKWRRVSAERRITPIAGSDVHENVNLPGLCAFDLCVDMVEDYPNMVDALSVEGPLMMPDGERLDSYGRIFRWVQNHVRINADADPFSAVEEAIESGRNIVVFEVLGVAPGVDLLAMQGSDVHEMGAEVSLAAGATLWARSPDAPTPGQNASWTDGTAAVIEATVHRSHGDETVAVASVTGPGAWLEVPLDAPGSYQLEVTVQPLHLVEALGSAHAYAQNTYRWVETGAIRVVSP